MTITIITVGAQPKHAIADIIEGYISRLPKHVSVTWRFLKHGVGDPTLSVSQESESIMRNLTDTMRVVLLDETGTMLSSPELSSYMFSTGSDLAFIIGGAYGVDERVKQRADVRLALGKLVYPHQLVRIILAEQIYRAHTIHTGHPYHHA